MDVATVQQRSYSAQHARRFAAEKGGAARPAQQLQSGLGLAREAGRSGWNPSTHLRAPSPGRRRRARLAPPLGRGARAPGSLPSHSRPSVCRASRPLRGSRSSRFTVALPTAGFPASTRSRAASGPRCIGGASGPCVNTPASPARARPTGASSCCSRAARRGSPRPSICRHRSATTPIIRSRSTRSGASACPSTAWPTWSACSRAFPSPASRPR